MPKEEEIVEGIKGLMIQGYVDPLFRFHKLNAEGVDKAEQIASVFTYALARLRSLCPEGREFSIVQTKLEEACFFAKKAMAKYPLHQEGVTVRNDKP